MLDASLSVNTKLVYNNGLTAFDKFRELHSLLHVWPAPIMHITSFISFLFTHGYAPSTASTYISAISFKHKVSNVVDTAQNYVVVKMLEGFRRMRNRADSRVPILYDTLISICNGLPTICSTHYEALLFKAAYTLAFFGLFRVSELVFTSPLQADRPLFFTDMIMTSKKTRYR